MANNNHFKVTALAAAIAAAGAVTPAHAFEYVQDDFRMQVDTTVSMGAAWRASDIDYRNVGEQNALAAQAAGDNPSGQQHPDTSSQDNGDLAWKKGSTYSEVVKATIDLELNYKDYGAFIRGHAYYDHRIVNGDGRTHYPAYYPGSPDDQQNLSPEPNQSDGRSADILDAFVWGNWYLGEMPLNVRAGRQVVSWGEGLFFANGINSINPVDVNALLTPGSELKEALLPVGLIYTSLGLTENLSIELFYQYEWEKTEIPYCGNFFATSDTVPDSCEAGFFAGGTDPGALVGGIPGAYASQVNLKRTNNIEPDTDKQYGFAFRYYIDPIETEVGFYHIRYDSRTPTAGVTMPNRVDFSEIESSIESFRSNVINGTLYGINPALVGIHDPASWTPDLNGNNASLGLTAYELLQNSIATGYTQFVTDMTPFLGASTTVVADAFASAFITNGIFMQPAGGLTVEYPEDIRLWGISFNTNIDFGLPGGATAVSGEVSYRENQPMQIEDAQVIAGVIALPSQICGGASCYATHDFGDYVQGYVREEFYQAEVAFIHFLDRILGASRWVVVLDMAYNYATIPDQEEILLNGAYPATLTPENFDAYPDANSWGYRMRFAGEYSNVFAGVNLKPVISFNHDVEGNSPLGTFIEDRKAIGLSLEAEYEHAYTLKVSYTDFYGAEPYNQLADRDFYAISASASF